MLSLKLIREDPSILEKALKARQQPTGVVAELVALIRAAKRGDGAPAPLALAKRPTALSDGPSAIGDSDATT